MGKAEIARLWSVDSRTVKREMARFRAQGWLVSKRQSARGRVSLCGLDLEKITEGTRLAWPLIGEDCVARIDPAPAGPVAGNVVPLRPGPTPVRDGSLWAEAQTALHAADPVGFGARFGLLTEAAREDGFLVLVAPSRFHPIYVPTHLSGPLSAAVRRVDPTIRTVRVED